MGNPEDANMSNLTWQFINSLTALNIDFIFNCKKFRSGTLCGDRHNLSLQSGLSANIAVIAALNYINNRGWNTLSPGADMV